MGPLEAGDGHLRGPNVVATKVLRFAAIKDNDGGTPLVWMDWVILVLLWYPVTFGGFLSTRGARV